MLRTLLTRTASQNTVLSLLGAALMASSATASAGTANREKERSANYIYSQLITLQPNVPYIIETVNLSAGADTVLHVQNATGGTYLAGNDDCATTLYGCSGPRSFVTIPASSATRSVYVIVRAFSSSSAGTATLRISPVGLSPTEYAISFNAGYKKTFTSYQYGTHFQTTEEQGGTSDTIMLITSQAVARAVGWDDDHGVGNMSFLEAPEACSSGCAAIVGTYSSSGSGSTTFTWDEDVHATDSDADGLSNTLEAALGTSATAVDSDGDGLQDAEETYGVDTANLRLRLPMYGAEPTQPDLFIEADWMECQPAYPGDTTCGGSYQNPDIDYWRLSGTSAAQVAAYYDPEVRVHIDTGVANADPTTKTIYNNWGGASRHTTRTLNSCEWLSSERIGFFHGGRLEGGSGGYTDSLTCFNSGVNAASIAHECGHTLNLSHGPSQAGGVVRNCAPNYLSLMSYSVMYTGREFSRNEFGGTPLNPVSLDEQAGLGTTDPDLLAHLSTSLYRYNVNSSTGAIDWNRNGVYDTQPVQADPAYGFAGGGCDHIFFKMDKVASVNRENSALAWITFLNAPVQPRLFWFNRRLGDGKMEYRYATSLPENCGNPPSDSCITNWYPSVNSDATLISSSVDGTGAPAATHTVLNGTPTLVLAYRDSGQRLRYQYLTNVTTWSSPAYVDATTPIHSSPAVVEYGGDVYLYAVSYDVLQQWKLSSNGTWSGPVAQLWTNSTDVRAAYGIGIARGYVKDSGVVSQRVIAAIPSSVSNPLGQVDLAWKDPATNTWTRLDDAKWPNGKPYTNEPPGLAYVPYRADEDLTEGRFYVGWVPPYTGSCPNGSLMAITEGNDVSSAAYARRLRWVLPAIYMGNVWGCDQGNMALLFDLDFDHNLRSAYTTVVFNPQPQPMFAPVTDGIMNGELRDQNDYSVILHNLPCSLGKGTCL